MTTETATLLRIKRRDMSLAAEIDTLVESRSVLPAGENPAGEPVYNVDLLLTAARVCKEEGKIIRRGGCLHSAGAERRAVYAGNSQN